MSPLEPSTETAEITPAAEAYLEQYGSPLVHNTYLKLSNLVLLALLAGGGIVYLRTVQALAHKPPIVIRISDVGRAEAVDYRSVQYQPQEPENRYYLAQWAQLYFGRDGYKVHRDYGNSLFFLSAALQRQALVEEQKTQAIFKYQHDPLAPYVDVEVKNVVLDGLREAPYGARIEFAKVFTNPNDHAEIKREQWVANVTYDFRPAVENGELPVNPLGLTILRFNADQAF